MRQAPPTYSDVIESAADVCRLVFHGLNPDYCDQMWGFEVFDVMTLTWLSWVTGDPETLTVWHLKFNRVFCSDPVLWPVPSLSDTGGDRGERWTALHNKSVTPAGRIIKASRAMLGETFRHTHRESLAYFSHPNCLLENKHQSLYEDFQSRIWKD